MADWYFLDPDNNKDDPENTDLFCQRCKRVFKEGQKHHSITRNGNVPPLFKLDSTGTDYIGDNCFKKVKKEHGVISNN